MIQYISGLNKTCLGPKTFTTNNSRRGFDYPACSGSGLEFFLPFGPNQWDSIQNHYFYVGLNKCSYSTENLKRAGSTCWCVHIYSSQLSNLVGHPEIEDSVTQEPAWPTTVWMAFPWLYVNLINIRSRSPDYSSSFLCAKVLYTRATCSLQLILVKILLTWTVYCLNLFFIMTFVQYQMMCVLVHLLAAKNI